MSIQDTDTFLVNRDENSFQVQASNLMATIQDDDLMLVNRDGQSYKVTAKEVKDDLGGGGGTPVPPDLTSASLTEQNPGAEPRFTDQKFDVSASLANQGSPVSTKEIQAKVSGQIITSGQFEELLESSSVDTIQNNYSSETFFTSVGLSNVQNGFDGNKETLIAASDPQQASIGCLYGVNFTTPIVVKDTFIYSSVQQQLAEQGQWQLYFNFSSDAGQVSIDPYNDSRVTYDDSNAPYRDYIIDVSGFTADQKVFTGFSVQCTMFSSANNYFTLWSALTVDGRMLLDTQLDTNLNFATGTDMTFLASGDKVSQGEIVAAETWSSYMFGTSIAKDMFDGNLGTTAQSSAAISPIEFNASATTLDLRDAEVWWYVGFQFDISERAEIFIDGRLHDTAARDDQGYLKYNLGENWSGGIIGQVGFRRAGGSQLTVCSAFYINGEMLIDDQPFNLITASGTVSGVSGTTATLSSSTGTWTNGVNVTGPDKQDLVTDNATKYLQFTEDGTVQSLISGPMDPPYTTQDFDPSLTLTFPGTFPSGNTPDEELGDGTKLIVDVTASNQYGTETKSAEVQPSTYDGPALGGMTTLYTGNGADQAIVNNIDLANNGGMVWLKNRAVGYSNVLIDTERGAGFAIVSDANINQITNELLPKSFNNNGFTLGNETSVNGSGEDIVAWTFEKKAEYFDVVKYTGNGTSSFQNIPHNLGTVPGCMIIKDLTGANNWTVYHTSLGQLKFLNLNTNSAMQDGSHWNNTRPTSTEFTVGPQAMTNDSGHEYIAYLFAENSDFIRCGFYDGDGSVSNRVEVGFEPQWLLIKCSSNNEAWLIADSKRGLTGSNDGVLYANTAAQENQVNTASTDATGFTLTNAWGTINASGWTYTYIAIAAPPTRSLTQEEFNEQALKFATYQNRKEVQCGKMAEAQRDDLIKAMAEKGYNLDDILKYL